MHSAHQHVMEYVLGARLYWAQGHKGERAGPALEKLR